MTDTPIAAPFAVRRDEYEPIWRVFKVEAGAIVWPPVGRFGNRIDAVRFYERKMAGQRGDGQIEEARG